MEFRDLFIRTKVEDVQGPESEPRVADPAGKTKSKLVPVHSEMELEQRASPVEAAPVLEPDAELLTQATHIPHRGPAPFQPPPAESRSAKFAEQNKRAAEAAERAQYSRTTRSAEPLKRVPTQAPQPAPGTISQLTAAAADDRRMTPREQKRPGPRIPRHSSGWSAMLKHLKEEPSLRVLDIGPTSPNNINFLTGMGHSVYMADIVQEALSGEWELPPESAGEGSRFDLHRFFERNLDFGDRHFDVVLLWTTIDYLPDNLIPPLIARLYESIDPGGQVLAFFHTRTQGPNTAFSRYHLVDSTEIDVQESGGYPVLHVYTNREIERLFKVYSGYKFFLAKDNVYEVIITK